MINIETIKFVKMLDRLAEITKGGISEFKKATKYDINSSYISYENEKIFSIAVIAFLITLRNKNYTSKIDFNNKDFYNLMEKHNEVPKISQITHFQLQEIYLKSAKSGITNLIMILINSKESSYAAELFCEEHPEYRDVFHVHSFDGMGYGALYGSLVAEAA